MALQTKTFSHGSVTDKSLLNGYVLELTVTEQSIDKVQNTSLVEFVLKLRSGSKNRFEKYGLGASVSLDGKVVGTRDRYKEDQVSLGYNSSVTLVKNSCTIAHNNDGTKSLTVAFSIDMATGSYVPGPVSVTGKEMTLSTIPRASTIAASDANVGAVSTVVVGRKSGSYTHTVAVKFGNLTGYLDADGRLVASPEKLSAVTIPFTVPESFYGEIPNNASEKCALTCVTYAGNSQIGTSTASFTVTAAKELCTPDVTIVVKDVNPEAVELTGNENMLVRYVSTARCEVSAQAKNSAAVVSLKVDGAEVAEGIAEFAMVEQDNFTVTCTDSRSYSTSATANAEMIPYVKLTCNAAAKRLTPTDGTARLTVRGNCYNGGFGAKDNTLAVTYQVGGGAPVAVEAVISEHTYTAVADLADLDYTQAFVITVAVTDAVTTVTKTVTLQPGIPVFDWGQNDFSFHVPLQIQGSPLVDFVVEQGSGDVWHYRKWANGHAECWGDAQVTVPQGLSQSGAVYWSEPVYVDYPFAITDAYRLTTIANVGVLCAQLTENHSDKLSFRLICTNENQAGKTATVHMYVCGRWK